MNVTCPACRKTSDAPDGTSRCPACGASLAVASDAPTIVYEPPKDGPDPADLLQEGQMLGGCRVERLLGHGGMGVVYLGVQQSLGRRVALKVLATRFSQDAAFVARFDREAAALAGLNHPNIIAVYDKGVQDGRYYFAMEFVEGVSLRQVMVQKALRPAELLKVMPAICEALDYAHAQGVIHRDIKPENLLITRTGQPKIADFGLAHLAQGPQDLALTQTQSIMGTMDYMAPEARISAKAGDHRVDIYAMGVVLYEILTGEMPLGHFPPPSEKGQDPRFDAVIHKALERDPARRFQHVSEIGQAVTRITTTPPPMPGRGDPLPDMPAGGRFGFSPSPGAAKASVTFSCSCGRSVTVDAARAGQEFMCSGCGKILKIPARAEAPAASPSPALVPAATPSRSPTLLAPSGLSSAPPADAKPCRQCGAPLVPGVPQCLKCGMSVRKMVSEMKPGEGDTKPCPSCGRPIPYTALGCRHCGAFFDDPESLQAARAKGLFPWHARDREGAFGSGLSTVKLVLLHPFEAFERLSRAPEAGAALKFHLGFGMSGAAICLFWYAILPGGLMKSQLSQIKPLPDWVSRPWIPMHLILGGGLLGAALLPVLQAALAQAGLFLTGGPGRAGFRGTLAVALYATGSGIVLAGVLPFCGGAAAALWIPVVFLIGLSRVQDCGIPRALLASLLGPMVAAAVLHALLSP